MKQYRAGIDIGSTTVKLVILDRNDRVVFGEYRRHQARTQQTLAELLGEARKQTGDCSLQLRITGSGALGIAQSLGVEFVQEVVATCAAVQHTAPQTDVAIELGGEDAKIIYFTGGIEERMNGVCAGGTGSFIDQMAALLQTDAAGLDRLAERYKQIYPIAARCGVFAKSDIQPLINEGAAAEDLAASIFQAVVNQTISGLACGKPIRGTVAFLGGPLHFLPQLKAAFVRTLRLTPETTVDPENAHLFAALGAALEAEGQPIALAELLLRLERGVPVKSELSRLEPLFRDREAFAQFRSRHERARVVRGELAAYTGDCYLGIDAGSTTTKLALIDRDGRLIWSFYSSNRGNPIRTAMEAVEQLGKVLPAGARIARACATGYGEGLLKTAFCLDDGEVETVAHTTAAAFFDPQVDCVLDIGGQDMKFIKLKNGVVDSVILNEACSSGCGSFIENFANSLGYSAEEFAREALFAAAPVDLGTRCTVFMNSNVKQAQKEGADVADLAAGLAYSVIKNALYKVIKLAGPNDLGSHIVVQGGTFHNQAVLRAIEQILDREVTCPDIAGLMGAFGAALIARSRDRSAGSTMLSISEIGRLEYQTSTVRCGGCGNNCMLTVNRFPGNRRHITGNRCEKGLGGSGARRDVPDLTAYKRQRIFDIPVLPPERAPRGTVGIPRVLNIYENYPFWATLLTELGYAVQLSPWSDRSIYELGMESIPSESTCYPAKLAHGHVQWLADHGVATIFHPCVFYEHQETRDAQNHYNCPIVVSYPENLKNNVEAVTSGQVRYIRPFIALTSEQTAADRLVRLFSKEWDPIPEGTVRAAVHNAWLAQLKAKEDIRARGKEALEWMEKTGSRGIVLAGRPYHMDPEINHGIPELITSYGLAVLTEDSLPATFEPERPVRVVDQWVYHSRLYTAAQFVRDREDLELIQLNSFGCGLDAVTTDQVAEILEGSGKLYTLLKIDEVSNLGAARIRVRSLLSAMEARRDRRIRPEPKPTVYHRTEFTRQMFEDKYTILAPQMSPIHFDLLEPVVAAHGFHIEVLKNDDRTAIETGLQYVNNDACFPAITVVGQIMEAVLSGRYDTDRLAVIMTQTGGCCRASNYVAFIRRAFDKAGMSHIPVISLNAGGLEQNSGFQLSLPLVLAAAKGLVLGDLLMRCLYRVRPYEKVPGSANELYRIWRDKCVRSLLGSGMSYSEVCRGIVRDFDMLPLTEGLRKPRVGIVGEILVKYMPLANNHLVDLLEQEGAEAVVPDLMDFMNYCLYSNIYGHEFLGLPRKAAVTAKLGVAAIRLLRRPAIKALEQSRRFEAPVAIERVADLAKPILSIGNQYGEGWFLTGEMAELLEGGVPNIICIQPFACLPNHVVGKGVIKRLREIYPQANIAAVDYDPGASEVNQVNRIKLMLSAAKKNLQ